VSRIDQKADGEDGEGAGGRPLNIRMFLLLIWQSGVDVNRMLALSWDKLDGKRLKPVMIIH
jgi:hypothetical protein